MSHQVFSYVRVSSKGQLEGDGPDRQRDAISAFCSTHKLLCMGRFIESTSGTVEGLDRPEFSDMLERIPHMERNGIHIEAIVVERADRLARDLMVSELLLAECRKRNIKVFSADQSALVDIATNTGDPTHKLIRQVIAAVAEFEKSCLVRKLRLSRERMKARTGRCEGNKPYGSYPGEQAMLNYMQAILLAGGDMPSYQSLTNSLNQNGFRNRNGKPWTRSLVFDLVKNHLTKVAA